MAESPGPATTGRSSVQQSTEQDANSSYPSPSPPHPLPLKRKKKEPGTPTWKNVVVLKSSDVRKIGDKVLMPFTTQMSTIKKSLIPRFQKVEISSAMTKMEVKAKLEEVFPYLRQQRFFCAKAVEGGTRLDFYGEPSIWDGKLIKKILPGNYVLYILTYEENDDEQDPTVSNLSTNTCSLHNPMVTTGSLRERDQVPQRVDSRDLSGHVSSVEPIQCSSDCGTVPSCSSSQQSPAVDVEVNRTLTRACTNNATENEETLESNNESQSSDWPSDSGIEGTDNSSVDERGNGNLDLGVTINPPAVPLQGGPFCCFDFTPMLPLWFNSGTATFGELGRVELFRHNNSLIGRHIPGRSEAGSETVTLRSEYGVFLAQTEIQYYDEVQRAIEFVVGNKKHHRRLFEALAAISESPTGDGQISGSCGSTQPLKTLKLSVYAAAKFGAKQFLKTVFESKAGRKVFNAYKDHPPLPEVIAWKYGHEETANYLEDITIRFSREANIFPEEPQEIDWQELIALSEETKENQELCISCDDENHRAECDVIIDTGYLGDTETSSSTMSSPSRSDSEIDDTGFCFKVHGITQMRGETCDDAEGKLPPLRPPVIIVGTHADKPFEDITTMKLKIQKEIAGKDYEGHVVQPIFSIDNTSKLIQRRLKEVFRKDTNIDGIQELRDKIMEVLSKEPYMKESIPVRGFLESNGAQQHPEERLQPTEQEEVMVQESREIDLRERMEGQANGGEDNLDPVFYVPPYTPNQLMELEVPLQPLLQSVPFSPVREQANEGYLPVTVPSANQLSYRQEQTGASVLANRAGYPPEAANNVGRLPVEHPDMPELPLHQHQILNRLYPQEPVPSIGQNCGGKYTWKIKHFSQHIQDAFNGIITSHGSPPIYTGLGEYKFFMRIFPNGVNGGDERHIGLFVGMMQGEYDTILEWPFCGRIVLTIKDQTGDVNGLRNDISGTFMAKKNVGAFQKPTAAGPYSTLYGYAEFAPIALVCSPQYLKDDTVMIQIEIHKNI